MNAVSHPSTLMSSLSTDGEVDIDNITSIRLETSCPVNSRSPNMVSKYSFSILSGEMSLLDLDAVHVYQFAEWTDGIAVLGRGDHASMRHKESLDKVRVGNIQSLRGAGAKRRSDLSRRSVEGSFTRHHRGWSRPAGEGTDRARSVNSVIVIDELS